MKFLFILILILIAPFSNTEAQTLQKITIVPVTEETDYSSLNSDHAQVKKFIEISPPEPDALLLPSERDARLVEIGLGPEINKLDDLDRDRLLWTVYHKGAKATHVKFPKIPEALLEKASVKMDE